MERLQEIINGYGFGISKEKLVERAYRILGLEGYNAYVVNEKYISINGKEYQLIKSRKESRWIAKEF